MPATRTLLRGADRDLLLKSGDEFDVRRFNLSQVAIETYLHSSLPSNGIAVTVPRLEACSNHSVTVDFKVFAIAIPQDAADLYKLGSSLIRTPATAGGTLGSFGRIRVVPTLNYNRTRGVYGGGDLRAALPLPIIQQFSATPQVSGNSFSGSATLDGHVDLKRDLLSKLTWQGSIDDYNVPVTTVSLTRAVLGIAAFGSSKEFSSGVVLNYGAYLGGGHVQDGFHLTPNSQFGELKMLAGIQEQRAQSLMSASYGIQIGTTFSQTRPFVKHIVDLRFSHVIAPLPRYLTDKHAPDDRTRFIGATHRPLSVELQANAGILSRLNGVPSVERFFGGNRARAPFIPGEPWTVRDQPYIRSVPENELGSAITNATIGGARFYSANLSVAKVLWGRALVPSALGDQHFLEKLDGAFDSTQGELSDYYFDRNPKVSGIRSDARVIATELTTLKNNLSSLTTSLGSEPQVKSRLVAVRGSVTIAALTAHAIASGKVNETSLFIHLEVPSIEKGIGRLTSKLSAMGDTKPATALRSWRAPFKSDADLLISDWGNIDQTTLRAEANTRAKESMAPAVNIMNALLYRADSYSIAPVGIFDVARVWPGQGPTRYGVGGGVRLSIVNANFTSGYALNPDPQGNEPRGAVFFRISLTDLFH